MNNQENQQSYQLLIDMIKKYNDSIENEFNLQFILENIISVLPNTDTGLLYILDDDSDYLKRVVEYNSNIKPDQTYLQLSDNLADKCCEKKEAVILKGTKVISYCGNRLLKDLPKNLLPYATMIVPVMENNRPIGVMIFYNFNDKNHLFSKFDLVFLKNASSHLAVTISKMKLKEKEMEEKALETDWQNLLDIQSNFNKILLNGGAFPSILNYLKQAINGETILFDLFGENLYSTINYDWLKLSEFISDKKITDITEKKQYQNLTLLHNELGQVIITPVLAKQELMGFLITVLGERPFGSVDKTIITYACSVIALEWIKNDNLVKSRSTFFNKFFNSLLNPVNDISYSYARRLNINTSCDFCLLIVTGDIVDLDVNIISFYIEKIDEILGKSTLKGNAFSKDNNIYILLQFDLDYSQVHKDIDALEDKILSLNNKLILTRGGVYHSIENIKKTYADARQCLKMFNDYKITGRKIAFDSIGIWQLLSKLEKNNLYEFANSILKNLLNDNSEKSKEFLLTLQTYVANNKNIKDSANELGVHLNTIYFRIKKTEEILGVDFDDEKDWLSIQLACSILKRSNTLI